jgi:hypothetical protein
MDSVAMSTMERCWRFSEALTALWSSEVLQSELLAFGNFEGVVDM